MLSSIWPCLKIVRPEVLSSARSYITLVLVPIFLETISLEADAGFVDGLYS